MNVDFETSIMKKIAISILLAIAAALPLMAYTPQEAVNKFVSHSSLRYASLGVQVIDLDSARSIASYRPEQANITASTMKTVVSSAALGLLGPHFRFETPVYLDGELRDGSFKGNIIIRGLGDPTIGSVFLPCQANIVQEIIDALHALGISSIEGISQVPAHAHVLNSFCCSLKLLCLNLQTKQRCHEDECSSKFFVHIKIVDVVLLLQNYIIILNQQMNEVAILN